MARAVAPHAIRVALRPVTLLELADLADRLLVVHTVRQDTAFRGEVPARSAGLGLRVARAALFMLRHVRLFREDLRAVRTMPAFDFVHVTTTFLLPRTAS